MKQIQIVLLLLLPFCGTSQQKKLIPYRKGDKFGYSNPSGKLVIQPDFLYTNFFINKVAAVRIHSDNKKAYPGGIATIYINQKGKIAIEDTFEFGGNFYKELVEDKPGHIIKTFIAEVKKNNEYFYIDESGNRVTKMIISEDVPVPESFLIRKESKEVATNALLDIYREEGKWGVRNDKNIIVPAIYDDVYPVEMGRGIYLVRTSEKRAILNLNNKQPLKWYNDVRRLLPFNDAEPMYYFSVVDSSNLYGIVDENNQVLLNNSYDYIESKIDRNGAVLIRKAFVNASKGKIDGIFDLKNRILVPPKYEYLTTTVVDGIYRVEFLTSNKRHRDYYISINGLEYYSE